MNSFPEIKNNQGELLDHHFHPAALTDYLVVLGHGVTGNKDRPLLIALAEGLALRGWPCLRISFAGNGQSQGDFREATITKEIGDLQAVLAAVPDGVQVAYCGHSMGGAVGVLTAVRDDRMRALITLSGMVETRAFCQREFGEVTPDQGCMWDDEECPLSQKFIDDLHQHGNTLDAAAAIEIPWLMMHGLNDDVVPFADSEAAFAVAPQPKEFLPIAGEGHSFSEQSYPRMVETIDQWLREHWKLSPSE